jgi:hypothetical protein
LSVIRLEWHALKGRGEAIAGTTTRFAKQYYANAGVRSASTIAGPFTALLLNRPAVYGGLYASLWSFS